MAPPNYAQTLRERRAFAGLVWSDAHRAVTAIADTIFFYGNHGSRGDDPRCIEQRHNKSINARYKADGMNWQNPDRVAEAFAIAKAALTDRPWRPDWWNAG